MPRVIVDAANDITKAATASGLLLERVTKRYDYFDDETKDRVSDQYPHIIYKQVFDGQILWFIVDQLRKTAEVEKKMFDVLIISPTRDQARRIVEAIKGQGLKNITFDKKQDGRRSSLQEAVRVLLQNKDSNLGWRLAARALMDDKTFAKALTESAFDKVVPFCNHLSSELKKQVRSILTVMRAIRDNKTVDKKRVAEIARQVGLDQHEMSMDALKDQVAEVTTSGGVSSVRGIPIKATTVQSSKGLAADYVFITHFDDFWFIGNKNKKKVSDRDVCCFLVALTRAKKKLFLVSAKEIDPLFLKWIKPERIERL
jgi:superfamily I DNA/RNA helicase